MAASSDFTTIPFRDKSLRYALFVLPKIYTDFLTLPLARTLSANPCRSLVYLRLLPFKPYPYKKLYLAVGYAKERDTAIVEIDGCRFIPERIRVNKYAFWVIAYHIGKVLEVHRK